MKKISFIKIIVTGVIAFIALTFFSSFYYNIPIHEECADGATDYKWEANKLYISMNEGIGYGKTNNEGYMNIDDYDGDVDILFMGSSHIQGLQIPIENNVVNILNNEISDNVYNIAISGHSLKTCISNLDNALKKYKPKIVIIETNKLCFPEQDINEILNGEVNDVGSKNDGIIGVLQKNPFIRLVYMQISSFINNSNPDMTIKSFNYNLTNELIRYIKEISSSNNCELILLFHPSISIDNYGNLLADDEEKNYQDFSEICNNNDVYFVDMYEKYNYEYKNNKLLPTGFNNTAVGFGHINSNGHRMMADVLSELIKEIDN